MQSPERFFCVKPLWNLGILSRITSGFEPRQNHAGAQNPGYGVIVVVLVHPSHICQIGESDQGHFGSFYRRHVRGALDALSESLDGFLEICEFAVLTHDLSSSGKFLEQEYSDYFCLL